LLAGAQGGVKSSGSAATTLLPPRQVQCPSAAWQALALRMEQGAVYAL